MTYKGQFSLAGAGKTSTPALMNYFRGENASRCLRLPALSRPVRPTQAVSGVLVEAEPQDPSQAAQYTLAYWADALGAWLPVRLYPENSSDVEDETVPFMVRIENAVPGGTYTFDVRLDCAHEPLESSDGGGARPDLYIEGPDSAIADAVLADDGDTIKLWGGSFASADVGPADVNLCRPEEADNGTDAYAIALAARSETLYVIWDVRLASPTE